MKLMKSDVTHTELNRESVSGDMLRESKKHARRCLRLQQTRPDEKSYALTNMAQHNSDCGNLLPAMAVPLASIVDDDVSVAQVGILSNEASLLAPLHSGCKIVLDLTPGEDDWLEIIGANSAALPHHEGEETQALHLAIQLKDEEGARLDALDKVIQRKMNYSVMRSRKAWKGMHRGGGKVIVNVILGNSVALTPLRFVQGGVMKKGFGKAFLDQCLDGADLKDFYCKAKVELECIQETAEDFCINLTVHSIIFAPMPKRTIVDFTPDEEEAVIRAAKRLKYRF